MPMEKDDPDRGRRERERIIKEQKDYEAERQRREREIIRDTHKPPKPPDDEK
jgi:hypothetical protein